MLEHYTLGILNFEASLSLGKLRSHRINHIKIEDQGLTVAVERMEAKKVDSIIGVASGQEIIALFMGKQYRWEAWRVCDGRAIMPTEDQNDPRPYHFAVGYDLDRGLAAIGVMYEYITNGLEPSADAT